MANIDTTDMEALVSRVMPEGIYVVEGEDVSVIESDGSNENAPLFRIKFKAKVLKADPLDQTIDPESLEDKRLNPEFPIWSQEDIQYLMGDFKRAGLPYKGPMVAADGTPTGWLADYVGARLVYRVTHRKAGDDVFANYRWMPYED